VRSTLAFARLHLKCRSGILTTLLILFLGATDVCARPPFVLPSTRTQSPPEIDGAILEKAWEAAARADSFMQYEPALGSLSDSRTEAMVSAQQGVAAADVDLSKLEAIFYLEPSYFGAMMLEIEERCGSLDTYLEDGLGMGPSDQESLRDLLTHEKMG
jgi:hypothetical protein